MAPMSKRRELSNIEEIKFDPEARQEYLTGFHKRKQQRIQNAKDEAAKREKAEKVKERREIREHRKEELDKRVAEVNAELRKQNPDADDDESLEEEHGVDDDWEGIEDGVPEVTQDEEYVDEDKYTTVTVEPMGDRDEASEDAARASVENGLKKVNGDAAQSTQKKRTWPKDPDKPKSKKKKFRYESKAERQTTRQKQKSKNHKAKIRREGK